MVDSRIQLYFRPKGKAPCNGMEVKSEHYENDRRQLKQAVWEWLDEQLDYLEEREGEIDVSDDDK